MPRERTNKIYGPFRHGSRWRVVIVAADGTRTHARESEGGPGGFATRQAAEAYIDAFRDEADDRAIGIAVDTYLDHLRSQGRRPGTVTTARYRLHGLLRIAERDRHLHMLTPRHARELLARRRGEAAVDTQIGELAAARTFASWCVGQGWLPSDPFDELEVTGTRARGKAQLRIDEARRFVETALREGDARGLAAAMALLMGLRARRDNQPHRARRR